MQAKILECVFAGTNEPARPSFDNAICNKESFRSFGRMDFFSEDIPGP